MLAALSALWMITVLAAVLPALSQGELGALSRHVHHPGDRESWGWPGAGACPHFCACHRSHHGLRTAECVGSRLISVDIGLPRDTEAVDLSDNIVSGLEDGCFQGLGLVQIKELHLPHNTIRAVGLWAFAGMRRLRYLDLSYNHIEALHVNTFAANRGLKTLLLAGNNLARLPGDRPFLAASRLQVLDLSNCKLPHLGSAVLSELPALASLNLSANYMIQLQQQAVKHQSQLQILDLSRNPLACDTNTRNMVELLTSQNVTVATTCPTQSTAAHPQPSRHLARLLADVRPDPGQPHPDVQVGARNVNGRQTHEKMVQFVAKFPEEWQGVTADEDIEWADRDNLEDQSEKTRGQATDKAHCPPLFPERTSKNPALVREWFDQIPSFWAAITGFQVGMAMGLVLSACACRGSFWRAVCTCKPSARSGGRRRRGARLGVDRASLDQFSDSSCSCPDIVRDVFGSASSSRASERGEDGLTHCPPASSCEPLVRDQRSSCESARARSETPPPAYSELVRCGFRIP